MNHELQPGSAASGSQSEIPPQHDLPVLKIGMDENCESRLSSLSARACLVLGLLGLIVCLIAFFDLPNRLHIPRSISVYAEEARTWSWYMVSLGLSMLAIVTDYLSRRTTQSRGIRLLGFLCVLCTLVVLFTWLAANEIFGWEQTRGRRAQCTNNLKQIELAFYNYEQAHGAFPPRASRDREGRPLLSWRVLILPYLDEEDLYSHFHLDEPWDSPHNRALLASMPSMLACPAQAKWIGNQTVYQVLDGPGTFLDSSAPTALKLIRDETSTTITVLESPVPVPWTSPQDLPFRIDQPFPGWEVTHPGGINCAFVDGSVHFVKRTIRESMLKALATRAGGERITFDDD